MEKELRKNQHLLAILGAGVIAFGFWTMIKTILVFALQTDRIMTLMEKSNPDLSSSDMTAVIISVLVFLVADLSVRLYIGLSARAEGLGKKSGRVYLVLTVLLIAGAVLIEVLAVTGFDMEDYDSVLDVGVTFLVGLTSLIVLLELRISAIRVKRLTKALKKGG